MTAPHVRRNVWTLPSGDHTIQEYAEAVAIMKARPASDPTSWSYQAAMHGTTTTPSKPLWNGCQHFGWYFLPWHRMFIYYFEQIVRAAVVQAGGSAGWTLPFWDYGAGGQQATLPQAFRQPTASGNPNPLYVAQRAQGVNGGLALSPAVASAAHALSRSKFTGAMQFGGGVTPAQQFAGSTGRVEQTPHNDVHNALGGLNGWMANPFQAAADPIFWLHHSNIDRLWFQWSSPAHKDPGDHRWNGHRYSFFDVHGNQVHMTPGDVRDIVGQLGYTYEGVPGHPAADLPTPQPVQAQAAMTPAGDAEEPQPEPEIVGASEQPVQLVGEPAQVALEIDPKASQAVLADTGAPEPAHIYLNVEDIEAERNPGTVYGIYVNLPDGAAPDVAEAHHAGNVSFFGVERPPDPSGDEQAHSLRVTVEITELAHELAAQGEWDGQHVTVTFRPLGLIPQDRPDLAHALPDTISTSDPPVTIGRVSISFG